MNIRYILVLILLCNYGFAHNLEVNATIKNKTELIQLETNITSVLTEVKKINQKLKNKEDGFDYIPILLVIIAGLLALFQIKANIIASARIEWTQNLRKTISQFLSEIMILNFNIKRVLELIEEGKTTDAETLYNSQTDSFKKVHEYGNQIKLFLNNQKEKEHIELQELIEKYLKNSTHGIKAKEFSELEKLEQDIIKSSQKMLKQTWEDAKTFYIKEIYKFKWKKTHNKTS